MSKRAHPTEDDGDLSPSYSFDNNLNGQHHRETQTEGELSPLSPHTAKYHRVDLDSRDSPDGMATSPSTVTNGGEGGGGDSSAQQPSTTTTTTTTVMTCTIPGCKMRQFPNSEAYETHYAKDHTSRCHECHRNFPSQRILECHIKENHDTLSQLKKERGEKIYECFVEGCDKICSAPVKRRRHLIDKHYYPQDFNFYVVNDGIDKMKSLLRSPPRKSRTRIRSPSDASSSNIGTMDIDSGAGTTGPQSPTHRRKKSNSFKQKGKLEEGEEPRKGNDDPPKRDKGEKRRSSNGEAEPGDDKMEEDVTAAAELKEEQDEVMQDLSSKMSAISMVPRAVKFGRKGTGFAKK